MIDVGPVGEEDFRRQRAAIRHGALAAIEMIHRGEIGPVEAHGDEDGLGIERRAGAIVAQVEVVVLALDAADGDIHPLDGTVGGIVNRVRMSHAAGRGGRPLREARCGRRW